MGSRWPCRRGEVCQTGCTTGESWRSPVPWFRLCLTPAAPLSRTQATAHSFRRHLPFSQALARSGTLRSSSPCAPPISDRFSLMPCTSRGRQTLQLQHEDRRMEGGKAKSPTLQAWQARNSLLQSMLAQLRCGSSGSPPQRAQLVAAGNLSGADPSSLPVQAQPTAITCGENGILYSCR